MFKWLSSLAREGRRGFLKRPRLAKNRELRLLQLITKPYATRSSDKNMTTENLVTARNKVESVYELINDLVSNHSIDMLDLAYPKNDGKQDASAVAEMMLLRQSANSLSQVCSFLVDRLTDAIGDENEVK